jgi:hypothetical protein
LCSLFIVCFHVVAIENIVCSCNSCRPELSWLLLQESWKPWRTTKAPLAPPSCSSLATAMTSPSARSPRKCSGHSTGAGMLRQNFLRLFVVRLTGAFRFGHGSEFCPAIFALYKRRTLRGCPYTCWTVRCPRSRYRFFSAILLSPRRRIRAASWRREHRVLRSNRTFSAAAREWFAVAGRNHPKADSLAMAVGEVLRSSSLVASTFLMCILQLRKALPALVILLVALLLLR